MRRRLGSDERADAVEARGAELRSGVRALERRRALPQTPGKSSQQSSLVSVTCHVATVAGRHSDEQTQSSMAAGPGASTAGPGQLAVNRGCLSALVDQDDGGAAPGRSAQQSLAVPTPLQTLCLPHPASPHAPHRRLGTRQQRRRLARPRRRSRRRRSWPGRGPTRRRGRGQFGSLGRCLSCTVSSDNAELSRPAAVSRGTGARMAKQP